MSAFSPGRVLPGLLAVLLGSLICLIAAGVIPTDERALHTPRWILFLCGMLFIAGGAATWAGPDSRIASVLAALIAVGMGTVGLWLAFTDDDAQMSGGLPFLSRESNILAARILFGAGGSLCYLFAAANVWQHWKRR